ncbi:MAG: hypothetical protein WCL16_13295, partial [bacterium]
MHLLMLLLMLTTLLTMAALLAWIRPAVAARWQQARAVSRAGLVGLWLAGTGFLLFFPHDDSFTGLDNMTYRHLSHAFLEGRGFHDPDTVLAGVPSDLRENFLLHRGPVGRPTRDRVFQLSGWQSVDAKPFFMPVLPLAAAGLDPLLAPERFVPIMGALWLALMLMAGFCAGGGWGILAVAALVLGTAWPAWFLRGFYAEGVGAILVAGVVAASAARPLRGGIFAVAGFAMGLAVSYHPTLVVLSVPVSLGLILERRAWKAAFGLATGLLAGLFPFWALTRWVCQPYGDWTRLQNLQQMIFIVPEHRAIALVLGILILTSVVALWAGFHPSVRIWIRRMDERATPWAWLAACVLPLLLIVVLQGASGTALREGAVSVWSGIRWPYGLWLMAGAGLVLMKRRPVREHFWLAAFCWVALFFIFIKGVEIPAGLWS